jgi:hypothetical protein
MPCAQPSANPSPAQTKQDINADVRVISTPAKDWWDVTTFILNVVLASVGLAGVAIGVSTLRKVERQIRVAEADTQAMIRAERAWIVVSVQQQGDHFTFIAKNVGKTPARIASVWASPVLARFRDEKPLIPSDDQTAESLISTPPRLLPPTAEYIVHRYTLDDIKRMQQNAFWTVHIYGRIRYLDTLKTEASVPYETKWLYWHLPFDSAMPFLDPHYPEHNSYT